MSGTFTDGQLEAYLDESLPAEEMTAIEATARADERLVARLSDILRRRNAGLHTVGEIWRRHRLSCLTREQLGGFLLGTLVPAEADYVTFHTETVGCRWCQANLADLRRRHEESEQATQTRRRRYFESSAGYLDEWRDEAGEGDKGPSPRR